MPEAITYYDIARRIARAIPTKTKCRVIIHPLNFGKGALKGYNLWRSLGQDIVIIDDTKVLHHGKMLIISNHAIE